VSVTQQQVSRYAVQGWRPPRGRRPDQCKCVVGPSRSTDGKSVLFDQMSTPPRPAALGNRCGRRREAAVRAIPGVTVAMIALTAETQSPAPAEGHRRRTGHAQGCRPVSSHRPAAKSGVRRCRNSRKFQGLPRLDCGGLPGKGRCRQVDDGAQSGGWACVILGSARRFARRRHLRAHRLPRLTGIREKPQLNDDKKMISDCAVRSCDHVDRFSGRRGLPR